MSLPARISDQRRNLHVNRAENRVRRSLDARKFRSRGKQPALH